jgi:hypothetical protein
VPDILPIDTGSPARAELTPDPAPGRARLDARTAAEAEATHWRRLGLAEPDKASLAQLDADLQSLRLKRETEREARIRDGIRAEMAHLKYDADPDAVTRPFPYLRKGVSARRGGQS